MSDDKTGVLRQVMDWKTFFTKVLYHKFLQGALILIRKRFFRKALYLLTYPFVNGDLFKRLKYISIKCD